MNAITPIFDFRPAYWQLEPIERAFCDGYIEDIQDIADKTGQRLLAVLQSPFPHDLDQRGAALLARPMVRAAIAERVRELSELYDISINRTLREYTAIAYANIKNYIQVDQFGTPEIDLSKCTPEMLSAIKSFEIEDKPRGGRKVKFQLHDKLHALDGIAKYQGLFAEDNPHWRNQEQSVKPNSVSQLPANIDDDGAERFYSKTING